MQVLKRIEAKQHTAEWKGHVWQGNESIIQDSHHRPQDLRVLPVATVASAAGALPGAVAACVDDSEACIYDDLEGMLWQLCVRVRTTQAICH